MTWFAYQAMLNWHQISFRLLWCILFCFACYYGYLLYTPFLDTWFNEPTVIATDQADFPVEKLPFPAITICSNNKIVYRQLESVLRKQPWNGLMKLNYNITQNAADKGTFNNFWNSAQYTVQVFFISMYFVISIHDQDHHFLGDFCSWVWK